MKQLYTSAILILLTIGTLLGLPGITTFASDMISMEKTPQNQVIYSRSEGVSIPLVRLIIPKNQNIPPPVISANSALIKDLDSGVLMYVKEADKRVPIASTTKIMTALVSLEYYTPETVLKVPSLSKDIGSNMDLKENEIITFHSLLYGLLLNSGNDAAFTLASNYAGGEASFIEAMNKKAISLKLQNTHFDNPAGFDSINHFSSAYDLAIISEEALKNNNLSKIVSTKDTTVTSFDGKIPHHLININKLLNKEGVVGVKTGYTPQAKENLVALIERDGHKLLTIVLGSDDRFGETEKLMDWSFQNFIW